MRTLVVNALRLCGRRTAMGRYIEFLTQHWSSMEHPFDRILLMTPCGDDLEWIPSNSTIELRSVGQRWPHLLWEQLLLPYSARRASILFCPAYTCPMVYPGKIALANHGIYEAVEDEFSWWERLRATPINRASCHRADLVIANSSSTRDDLIKYLKASPSKIEIVYPAAHDIYFEEKDDREIEEVTRDVFGEVTPYILFVGKLAKRRNLPNLIRAFSLVRQRHSLDHRLLIVGPNTSDVPIERLIDEVGGKEVVTYIPHADMEPLSRLYAGADLFVLPTTYEGISWTMFEAMASGTAVLTTDHPTLDEGGGDAVYSVPTPSTENLVEGLSSLLLDDSLRESYERRGRQRADKFSWETHARTVMDMLDRVARRSDR